MGFFSNDCKGCGKSIKAPSELPAEIEWQNQCVRSDPLGAFHRGSYDGYGRILTEQRRQSGKRVIVDGARRDFAGEKLGEWWHTRCFEAAGSPVYSGPSKHSHDQGFFYDRTEAAR